LDAYRTDNLLLLGAVHFQLRNNSECIFYNQQAIRIDPNFAGEGVTAAATVLRPRRVTASVASSLPCCCEQRRTETLATR
jgi:hypothetical protein